MTVEETLVWRDLKVLAWKVYRRFRKLPGCYLEIEDFHMVGVSAVAIQLSKEPDTDIPLLKTIAYRRMVDYGQMRSDVTRHDAWSKESRGLKAMVSLEQVAFRLFSDESPLNSALASQVESWLEGERFGLTAREVQALRMHYWEGATYKQIVAALKLRGKSNALAGHWLEAARAKIRRGLKLAELNLLRNTAEYHRQLRARSAECRM